MPLPQIKTILYTSSMGKHTKSVFRHAVQQARLHNAKLCYLHVIEPIGDVGRALISGYLPQEMIDKLHNEGLDNLKSEIKQRVDKFFEDELAKLTDVSSVDIQTIIEQGPRAETIIDVCREIDADMVIMGSSKHIARMSPTTKAVVKSGVSTVLVVPTHK